MLHVQEPWLNGRPNIPYAEPVRARAGRAILRKEDMVVEVRDGIGTAGAMSVAGRWSGLGGAACSPGGVGAARTVDIKTARCLAAKLLGEWVGKMR